MPNNNTNTQKLEKGDVIWVPYRQDPMWPALVHGVYSKKVTYTFFPLPADSNSIKNRFSCQAKLTYALIPSEPLPVDSDADLVTAFRAASSYLNSMGKARGADIESLGEAEAREHANGETQTRRRLGKRKKSLMREVKKEEPDEHEEHEEQQQPAPKKKPTALERSSSSSSSSSQQPAPPPVITEQKSKKMMKLINGRMNEFEKVWNSKEAEECKRNSVAEKMDNVKLRNNQFLTDSDYETLFEQFVDMSREQNPQPSLLTAVHVTTAVLLPNFMILAYTKVENVTHKEASDLFWRRTRVLGLDPSMSIPVTDQLEQLCHLACNESDAI